MISSLRPFFRSLSPFHLLFSKRYFIQLGNVPVTFETYTGNVSSGPYVVYDEEGESTSQRQ